jgi:hypothetical protein
VKASTRSSGMSSSTRRSSSRQRNFVYWPSAGASTATPSDRTPRWATSDQRQRHG